MSELLQRAKTQGESLHSLTGVHCSLLKMGEPSTLVRLEGTPGRFCDACPYNQKNELKTHLYGLNEAKRWGGSFVYYCPEGLIFVAVTLNTPAGDLAGGLILGPVVMGEIQDVDCHIKHEELHDELERVKKMTTSQVRQLSELAAAAVAGISLLDMAAHGPYDQQKLMNTLYDMRAKYNGEKANYEYILEAESNLHTLIVQRDRKGSQDLLNRLLGHIYFYHNASLQELKARTLELIVVMSRAVIAAGADVGEIFRFSTTFILELDQFSSIDEICIWLSGIVHRFISASFDYVDIKHADTVYKVMEYIRDNCLNKLALEDIAGSVYLSKSYLSSIFKQETGVSITAYINRVRIEHSKHLLAETNMPLVDIANECCFEDQSYYTKVFKKYAGIPPKKYRSAIKKSAV